jgi:isochorismate synthase EntC
MFFDSKKFQKKKIQNNFNKIKKKNKKKNSKKKFKKVSKKISENFQNFRVQKIVLAKS